jgi:hypothetical protein
MSPVSSPPQTEGEVPTEPASDQGWGATQDCLPPQTEDEGPAEPTFDQGCGTSPIMSKKSSLRATAGNPRFGYFTYLNGSAVRGGFFHFRGSPALYSLLRRGV